MICTAWPGHARLKRAAQVAEGWATAVAMAGLAVLEWAEEGTDWVEEAKGWAAAAAAMAERG